MKSKILITGSEGFIGKKLVKKLNKKYNLFLIDKKKTKQIEIKIIRSTYKI